MHFDSKYRASLVLVLLLLSVEPGFCDALLNGKPDDISYIPPILRVKDSHKDLLVPDFKSLLENAQKGDAEAQAKVGTAYCDGIGVAQDYSQALAWLQKAPIVTVVKRDQGFFLHANGLIGNKIWQNFDLTIDFPGKKLYLKPNANFAGGPATSILPTASQAPPRGPD